MKTPTYTSRPDGCPPWTIVLTYQGRSAAFSSHVQQGREMKIPFFQGLARNKAPTLQDVLSSLFLDAGVGEMAFEDYCPEIGTARNWLARKTWLECKSTARRLRELLGDDYEAVRQGTQS